MTTVCRKWCLEGRLRRKCCNVRVSIVLQNDTARTRQKLYKTDALHQWRKFQSAACCRCCKTVEFSCFCSATFNGLHVQQLLIWWPNCWTLHCRYQLARAHVLSILGHDQSSALCGLQCFYCLCNGRCSGFHLPNWDGSTDHSFLGKIKVSTFVSAPVRVVRLFCRLTLCSCRCSVQCLGERHEQE